MSIIAKKADIVKEKNMVKLQKEILQTEEKLANSENMKKRDRKRNKKLAAQAN